MSYTAGRGWELEDGEELQERWGGERGAKTWRTERRCMLTMGGTIRKLERRRRKRRRTTLFHIGPHTPVVSALGVVYKRNVGQKT